MSEKVYRVERRRVYVYPKARFRYTLKRGVRRRICVVDSNGNILKYYRNGKRVEIPIQPFASGTDRWYTLTFNILWDALGIDTATEWSKEIVSDVRDHAVRSTPTKTVRRCVIITIGTPQLLAYILEARLRKQAAEAVARE